MEWKKKLTNSVLAQVFVSISYFLSGILVNIVQAVLFNTLAFFDIDLYRKINYFLTYTIWSRKFVFQYIL